MAVEKLTDRGVGRRLLRCHVCTRTAEVTATDVLKFTRVGWPTCCNEQVMGYFTESSPHDTHPDLYLPPVPR
jgi:hypothetical protein